MKTSLIAFSCVIVTIATLSLTGIQHRDVQSIREEFARAQAEAKNAATAKAHALEALALKNVELDRMRHDAAEVHRLRSEVRQLRQLPQQLESLQIENRRLHDDLVEARKASNPVVERKRAASEANETDFLIIHRKMTSAKNLGRAIVTLPGGFVPSDPHKLMNALSEEQQSRFSDFEPTFTGRIESLADPAQTIIMREKEAWNTPEGRLARTYLFSDGSARIRVADDEAEFRLWEQERAASER